MPALTKMNAEMSTVYFMFIIPGMECDLKINTCSVHAGSSNFIISDTFNISRTFPQNPGNPCKSKQTAMVYSLTL